MRRRASRPGKLLTSSFSFAGARAFLSAGILQRGGRASFEGYRKVLNQAIMKKNRIKDKTCRAISTSVQSRHQKRCLRVSGR